jgi:hypothetical protein
LPGPSTGDQRGWEPSNSGAVSNCSTCGMGWDKRSSCRSSNPRQACRICSAEHYQHGAMVTGAIEGTGGGAHAHSMDGHTAWEWAHPIQVWMHCWSSSPTSYAIYQVWMHSRSKSVNRAVQLWSTDPATEPGW